MSAQEKPFLAGRGLSKRYPGVLALDDVDGAIQSGVILGLVGKNGAGKSTLLKIFAGAIRPDEGEVLIDGEKVELHTPHDATKRGLAFVHQELADVPNLSVAENIELGLGFPKRMGLVNKRALRQKTAAVLKRLDVDIDPRAQVASLSLAQRRLVMIARGLAAEARLLVLDEPSASLTEEEIKHLHAVVRSLKSHGVAIIYVSHRLDEILSLTDYIGVMRDGKLVYNARTQDVSMSKLIQEITGSAAAAPERRKPRAVDDSREELLRVDGLTIPGIVEDASFVLRKGDLLGIAGLVGAGRTELVRAIFGADRTSTGAVHMHGRQVNITSPRAGLRAGIVLLPEDRRHQGTVQSFSVRKNVTLPSLKRYRRGPFPLPRVSQERRTHAGADRPPPRQSGARRAPGAPSVGRQPAEGSARQVAGIGRGRIHLRRAHSWDRRRRQGRRLQAHGGTRRSRQGSDLHLLGIHGAGGRLQPRGGDEGRPDRGRARG